MIRPGIKKPFRLAFHRREDAERDVRDEIRLHVELRTEQLVSGGMPPVEARREAERKFGSLADVRRCSTTFRAEDRRIPLASLAENLYTTSIMCIGLLCFLYTWHTKGQDNALA